MPCRRRARQPREARSSGRGPDVTTERSAPSLRAGTAPRRSGIACPAPTSRIRSTPRQAPSPAGPRTTPLAPGSPRHPPGTWPPPRRTSATARTPGDSLRLVPQPLLVLLRQRPDLNQVLRLPVLPHPALPPVVMTGPTSPNSFPNEPRRSKTRTSPTPACYRELLVTSRQLREDRALSAVADRDCCEGSAAICHTGVAGLLLPEAIAERGRGHTLAITTRVVGAEDGRSLTGYWGCSAVRRGEVARPIRRRLRTTPKLPSGEEKRDLREDVVARERGLP